MIRGFLVAIVMSVAVLKAALAQNHQGSLTTVDHISTEAKIEVVHRFFAYDVEEALSQLKGTPALLDSDPEAEDMVRQLVEPHFLLDDGEDAISLEWAGMQEDGEFLYVFQKAPMVMPPPSLGVVNTMLFSIFQGQTNSVHVRFPGMKRSANFSQGHETHQFGFDFQNQDDGKE